MEDTEIREQFTVKMHFQLKFAIFESVAQTNVR